jgi:molybdopterin-guanine dinucleotide biosynthesis protein A
VADSWRFLANVTQASQQLLTPGPSITAASLIYACDTPLVHPYLVQRVSEQSLAAAGLDPRGVPAAERKVVLLVTRMGDKAVLNGGRR